jgi:aspartate racemase
MLDNFLGVVGGIGPLATVYFMKRVIELTDVKTDQDHINMMVLSAAKIPDRTKFILGESQENPLDELLDCCRVLEKSGASLIAVPCNTSHYFYGELTREISTPIVHIQRETAKKLNELGPEKVGILATTGTISAGLFQKELTKVGVDYIIPDTEHQKQVMELIYNDVKAGKVPHKELFWKVAEWLFNAGCSRVVLGCTELSILKEWFLLDERFLDAMDVLAGFVIEYFGKKIKG